MVTRNPKFGEINSAEHSQDPESLEPDNLDGLDLIVINNKNATKPNVIKKLVGPFKGIVITGVGDQSFVEAGNSLFDFVGLGKKFAKCRVRIPEIHSHIPEPENYDQCPQSLASLYPEFVANSTDENQYPQVKAGTMVWCNFLDRENMQDPVYLGPVDKQTKATSSSADSSRQSNKSATSRNINKLSSNTTGLSVGNSATGDSLSGIQSNGQQVPSIKNAEYNSSKKIYEIVTNGKSEGFVEMVLIEGTDKMYPKKYIRALESMRQAYRNQTGKILGIESAYRDMILQKKLYDEYIARNKRPPVVGKPGYSLHNNGRAVDFQTGQPFNSNYERDFSATPTREEAESLVKQGKYGPVAKWLVENGRNFGYVWTGYSFRELWHYELNIDLGKRLGLIDG